MRKAQMCLVFLVLMFVVIWGIDTTYAAASAERVRYDSSEEVAICLQGLQEENGEMSPWREAPALLPGAVLSWVPRISNEGVDCYVRARWEFQDMAGKSVESLEAPIPWGMESNWLLAEDGYYYYTQILSSGKHVDVFQGIRIPDDLLQTQWEGKRVRMRVEVDAIQSSVVMPQYSEKEPWGEIKIPQRVPIEWAPESSGPVATGDPAKPGWHAISVTISGMAMLIACILLRRGGKT